MFDREEVRGQYDMIRCLFWGFGHSTRHNLWEGGSERAHNGGSIVRYSAFCTESCNAAIWIASVNQDKGASVNCAALRTSPIYARAKCIGKASIMWLSF